MRHALLLISALAVVAAACGDSGTTTAAPATSEPQSEIVIIRASTDLGLGSERILIALGGPNNERLGPPDLAVTFEVYPSEQPSAIQRVVGEWMWAIPDVSGLYRATVDFDQPGIWFADVITPDEGLIGSTALEVRAETLTPGIGTPAPASNTLTSDDAPIAEISTDTDPNPDFYDVSIADAVASGAPTVVVFATPRFCQTAICGPTLDTIKAIAGGYPDVNWVHVEVFTNLDDPANLELVPAVSEWGLPTEPWIFVVDADGLVRGRFEGLVSGGELAAVLDSLA